MITTSNGKKTALEYFQDVLEDLDNLSYYRGFKVNRKRGAPIPILYDIKAGKFTTEPEWGRTFLVTVTKAPAQKKLTRSEAHDFVSEAIMGDLAYILRAVSSSNPEEWPHIDQIEESFPEVKGYHLPGEIDFTRFEAYAAECLVYKNYYRAPSKASLDRAGLDQEKVKGIALDLIKSRVVEFGDYHLLPSIGRCLDDPKQSVEIILECLKDGVRKIKPCLYKLGNDSKSLKQLAIFVKSLTEHNDYKQADLDLIKSVAALYFKTHGRNDVRSLDSAYSQGMMLNIFGSLGLGAEHFKRVYTVSYSYVSGPKEYIDYQLIP